MSKRSKILLLAACGLVAISVWLAVSKRPAAVTLPNGTTLTFVSVSYGRSYRGESYALTPNPNPIKRLWNEVQTRLPSFKQPRQLFVPLGKNDAMLWFRYDRFSNWDNWSAPCYISKETEEPLFDIGWMWQNSVPGTIGIQWKNCPTNLPTLTVGFYLNTNNDQDTTHMKLLGRVTIKNPAYRR